MYKAAIVGCGHRAPTHIEAYQHIPGAEVVRASRRRRQGATRWLRNTACTPTPTSARWCRRCWGRDRPPGHVAGSARQPDDGGSAHRRAALHRREAHRHRRARLAEPVRFGGKRPNQVCRLPPGALASLSDAVPGCAAQRALGPRALPGYLRRDEHRRAGHAYAELRHVAGGRCARGSSRLWDAHGWDAADPGHPGPATTEAYLTFADGGRGSGRRATLPPRCGDPQTTWQHVRVAAYADTGRVLYEEFGKWEIVGPDGKGRGDFGGMDTWRANNLLAQAGFHRAMFDWLEDERRAPGTNLRQSLHEWAVVLALYQRHAGAASRRAGQLRSAGRFGGAVSGRLHVMYTPIGKRLRFC